MFHKILPNLILRKLFPKTLLGFYFTRVILQTVVELILRKLFSKMLLSLILLKLSREILSSIILQKVFHKMLSSFDVREPLFGKDMLCGFSASPVTEF